MRIAFLSSLDLNLYLFRLDIMKALQKQGDSVIAIIPDGKYSELIKENGIQVINYNLSRGSLNPLEAFKSISELAKILKTLNLDVLHTFTVKPNIFGTLAGKMAKVPTIYNLVEGLGSFYVDNSFKSKIVRKVIETSYKFAFKLSKKVVFVNQDDPKYLIEKGIIPKEKTHIIKSVGIDTEEFQQNLISDEVKNKLRIDLGIYESSKVVIMIARAILHKGTIDFYKSAELLKNENIEFLFVGGLDEGNKFGMSKDFMQNGNVKWLDWRDDIKELISISDIVILPSYREGVPRTLLEACSMGKPIIATDTVGCRETVDNGKNGFLIPIESPQIIAEKIQYIFSDNNLYSEMSKYSREKAEKEFDIKFIVQQYLAFYIISDFIEY